MLHLVVSLREVDNFGVAKHGRIVRVQEVVAFPIRGDSSHVQVEKHRPQQDASLRNTKVNLQFFGDFVINLDELLTV